MAEKAGLKMLASERFNRTDQSVTGQVLKVITAKPDAVLIAATGGPAVLPQTSLAGKGLQGPHFTRRTAWPPTTSSASAARRSRAR